MKKAHFIGIGGIGTSALAQYLAVSGYEVSGCDLCASAITDMLTQKGIKVNFPHNRKHCKDIDLVVYSKAVTDCDELDYCRSEGIKTVSREQLLGNIFNGYENSVAVSGMHGKTTTCGLILSAIQSCGISPTAFVGGLISGQGNFVRGDSNYCIAEACEYKGGFWTLNPKVGVILNVDLEHLDFYAQMQDIEKAYNRFAKNVSANGAVAYNGDSVPRYVLDGVSCKKVSFGFDKNNDYCAVNVKRINANYSFDFLANGAKAGRVSLSIVGRHNVYNALAALAVCDTLGLPLHKAISGVSAFIGTKRRFMLIPNSFTNIVEDYAHHPNEIKELIATAKQCGYGKLIVAFQPHTYTRTQKLFLDFVTAFLGADKLLLLPIYPAREKAIAGVTSYNLAKTINQAGITPAAYCSNFASAAKEIKLSAGKDDLVLIVGAGDINKLSDMLAKN